MLRGKLPSIYRTDNLMIGMKPLEGKVQINSHGNLRKDVHEPERPFGLKNNQSQMIHIKKKPAELKEDIDIGTSLIFNFGVKSRAGRVGMNRKINQDNYITNQLFMGSQENSFFCVLDGHGNDGHKVSHYLKMNLANSVAREFRKAGITDDTLFTETSHAGIVRAFLSTDAEMAKSNPTMTDVSGSTCVAVITLKDKLVCANLGDSCAGLVTMSNENWELHMLNREHKPTEKDERDRIDIAGGRVEPFRDQFGQFIGPVRVWRKYEQLPGLMMSRSFGDGKAHSCGVISTPENRNFTLDKTARAIVLGSDGMWEVLTIEKIRSIVAKYYKSKRSDEAASELLEASQVAWGKKNPMYCDDITCLVVFLNPHYFQKIAD